MSQWISKTFPNKQNTIIAKGNQTLISIKTISIPSPLTSKAKQDANKRTNT